MRSLSLDPPYEFRAGSMVASLLRNAWRDVAVFKTVQAADRAASQFPRSGDDQDQRPLSVG
jgi:hypothetical protein